jgi:hypothetical protein
MADSTVQRVPLAYGFGLDCSFPSMVTVEVTLRFRGLALWRGQFDADAGARRYRLNLGIARFDVEIDPRMFDGEIVLSFEACCRGLPRRLLSNFVLRFDPSLGEVGGDTGPHPPIVLDPAFGRSQACAPTILRIHVDDLDRELCRVGGIVKREMFPDYPPFVFNTVACVGAFPPGGRGLYTDPRSIWFNVFLGYYQLDCLKAGWSRPFGYESANGAKSKPVGEDLTRLGKSDWNWFSNWNYGVPEEALLPYSGIDMRTVKVVDKGVVPIGNSRWHEVELEGIEVASCYVSDAPGAGQLVGNTVLGEVWQRSFGLPSPDAGFPDSFVPTRVKAIVDMAYWEDEVAYHTAIFGGTASVRSDPAFLQAQLQVTKAVIAVDYPDLGFS